MLSGRAFRRRMWAPAIGAIGGGVLPTPVAKDDGKSPEAHLAMKARMKGGPRYTITSLAVLARNGMEQPTTLPTPKAGDGERGRDKARARPDTKGRELATVVRDQMLPTPNAGEAKQSGNVENWKRRQLEHAATGQDLQTPLTVAVQLLTPTATDWKGRTNWQAAGRNGPQRLPDLIPTGAATYLNPSFVEEMMGFPVGWTVCEP